MSFDFEKFADEIEKQFKGICGGYSFVVSYKDDWKQKRAGGDARHAIDAPAMKMATDIPFHLASVSKVITGAAMLKVLNKAGISYSDPFYKYLPSHWSIHQDIKNISFRQIMTHTSGLRSIGDEYHKLKKSMADGITIPPDKPYQNINFALMRFLIPTLAGYKIPQIKKAATPLEIAQALQYAEAYMDYVQKEIFDKAGLPKLSCHALPYVSGKSYHFPYLGHAGEDFGNKTLECGSEGWVMTAAQLAKFFRHLNYTGNILPATLGETMRSSRVGYDSAGTTKKGVSYYVKRGWYPGKKNRGELRTLAMGFSNEVSVVWIVNSEKAKGSKDDIDILTDAHDKAFIKLVVKNDFSAK